MSGKLENKVALITGAGRGIGAATARLLAREGAKVALVSRNSQQLAEVAGQINEYGGQALAITADVSDEQQVIEFFERTKAELGVPDILVNNAATIEIKKLVDMDLPTWEQVMAVNVRGPFLCSREAFRQLIAAEKGGTIINLSSLSGVRGPQKFPGFSAYVVSKYGVLGLTEILAVEGKSHGIRVNCISPGAVDTVMLKKAAPFLNTKTLPDDVAKTILYLADDEQSGHINGANIEIFSNEE